MVHTPRIAITIILFVTIILFIYTMKPDVAFTPDGRRKPFGIDKTRGETMISMEVIVVAVAFICFSAVRKWGDVLY